MADYDLPHDILFLIFFLLPVKSLLRFKCVSKSWNLLISTQDFAKMHLNYSRLNFKPLGLIWTNELMYEKCISRMHIFAVDCSKLGNSADTIQRLHHPFEVPDLMESTVLIGSCNGLLCATWFRYEESFLVFNPLTRKCFNFSGGHSWSSSGRSHYYGFGYDDVHDDYKVVTWGVRTFRNDFDCSKFDVYSVADGSWSTRVCGLTGSALTGSDKHGISCGVLVNYVLHWMWKTSGPRYNIIAFDLRTEEHMLMETPQDEMEKHTYGCGMELGVLNGCLCGIVFCSKTRNKLDLWIMKEYSKKDSWTKMIIELPCISYFGVVKITKLHKVMPIVPIVHVADKKHMMLYSYGEGFLLCDTVKNKVSKVFQMSKLGYSFVPKEFRFECSLVQPPGFHSFDSLWDEEMVAEWIIKQKKNKKTEEGCSNI